ncbi:MAG: hypothetical protein U9Q91_01135 [Candidatus Marinimicrobia bacterium]|nr:hypothetical protein [Candidatus Neomarinimicrobiota bacterium]
MKGFEKERNKTPNPLWVKLRFYILILLSTALILLLIISLDNAEHLMENILPAGISLTNAVIAYIVSKHKQGSRTYKQMMNNIKKWTIIRFIGMALFVFLPIITKVVEPLPFIFSFIGFYILHQLIEIVVLQKEVK